MLDDLKREPAILGGLAEAVVALVLALLVDLRGRHVAALMAVAGAVTAVAVRRKVVPVSDLLDAPGRDGVAA